MNKFEFVWKICVFISFVIATIEELRAAIIEFFKEPEETENK